MALLPVKGLSYSTMYMYTIETKNRREQYEHY